MTEAFQSLAFQWGAFQTLGTPSALAGTGKGPRAAIAVQSVAGTASRSVPSGSACRAAPSGAASRSTPSGR